MIIQQDFTLSNGCKRLKELLLSVYDYDADILSMYVNNVGDLWVYIKHYAERTVGDYGETETYIEEDLRVMSELVNNININSTIDADIEIINDGTIHNGYALWTLAITNNGITEYKQILEYYYYNDIISYEFIICGCNINDIRLGKCCFNICDLANKVKENYENILS